MKTIKISAVVVLLGCLGILTSNAFADYRTSFGVGFGHSEWRHHHHRWPGHFHHRGHWYYPGSYVVVDYWPDYPVIVEKQTVIVKDTRTVNVKPNAGVNDETFADIRSKKNILLEKLTIGDKTARMNAIAELAGFTYDDAVRDKLSVVILTDPDPEIRKAVAKSFGEVKNEKTLPILEKVRVSDSDAGVRQEAESAINQIKGN